VRELESVTLALQVATELRPAQIEYVVDMLPRGTHPRGGGLLSIWTLPNRHSILLIIHCIDRAGRIGSGGAARGGDVGMTPRAQADGLWCSAAIQCRADRWTDSAGWAGASFRGIRIGVRRDRAFSEGVRARAISPKPRQLLHAYLSCRDCIWRPRTRASVARF